MNRIDRITCDSHNRKLSYVHIHVHEHVLKVKLKFTTLYTLETDARRECTHVHVYQVS